MAKETSLILDVDEVTGAPRLTAENAFGSESRNGLLCAGDPVNRTDPSGLQFLPVKPSSQTINGYMGSYYQQNISPYTQGAMMYNNYVVPSYNAGLSLTSSSDFRLVLGQLQVGAGVVGVAEGVVLLGTPVGGLQIGAGVYEIIEGMENVSEGADGHGFDQGPPLKPLNLNLNYISYSGGGGNQQWSNAVGYAVNSAIGALSGAVQRYGSGYGYVTVTSGAGSQVVFGRRFDTTGFYGPNGPGNLSGAALGAYLQTKLGVPGGGGQPGEGFHPVPYSLF